MNSHYEKFLATGEVKCIDDEIPFEIPTTWSWCRLVNIGITETGTTPLKTHPEYFGNYIAFLGPANILNDKILSQTQGLSELGTKFSRVVPANTILQVCIGGSIGKCAITDREVAFNQQINSITPICSSVEYVHFVLQSETFRLAIMEKATGTATPIINRGNWEQLLFPLPPYNEQLRIVDKLQDVLPSLRHYSYAKSRLDELNITIPCILKKSILQEAIQGKLVPQFADEGTAQELLEQIRQEKQRLVKEGKLKKSALSDSVIYKGDDNRYYEQIGAETTDITEEIPFEIPSNWKWARLKELCTICTGATFKKEEANTESRGIRVLRGGNILPFELVIKPDDLFIPEQKVKENIILRQNDIVTPAVTSLENIGKMARVKETTPNVTVGGFVFIIRPLHTSTSFSRYLLSYMSSPSAIEYMKSITNKSGQAFYNIGKERLATILVPIPPLAEQERICNRIQETFSRIKA